MTCMDLPLTFGSRHSFTLGTLMEYNAPTLALGDSGKSFNPTMCLSSSSSIPHR